MKKTFLKDLIEENILTHKKILNLENEISSASNKIFDTLKKGNKIFICGNGGSAADAQHLAAEFLVRLRPNINRNNIHHNNIMSPKPNRNKNKVTIKRRK